MSDNRYSSDAVNKALQGHWEEAKTINKSIIELYPDDVSAHNRLAKALTKLGEYEEARKTYEQVLSLDPGNVIAKRNVQRLSYLKAEDGKGPQRGINTSIPLFFLEEAGKSRIVNLYNLAWQDKLVGMSAGDQVCLEIKGQTLSVVDNSGEYIGEIDPRIGSRLIGLIKGGNQYKAAIANMNSDQVRVMIREISCYPDLAGSLSFPPRANEEPKPLRDTMFKYDYESEIEAVDEFGEWKDEAKLPPDKGPDKQDNLPADELDKMNYGKRLK